MTNRKELLILECVRNGNYRTLCESVEAQKQEKIEKRFENMLCQKMYELIARATIVTRFAVKGGLNPEIAACFGLAHKVILLKA